MQAMLIGISLGFVIILAICFMKLSDKPVVYGLILSAIGFLYVGFTWTDTQSFVVNSIQAIFFLLVAYFGIRKNLYYLAAGYFLHGVWDFVYNRFQTADLIPPHYDLFCLAVDFTIGAYLLIARYWQVKRVNLPTSTKPATISPTPLNILL